MNRRQPGFTLIEIALVVFVVGLLASLIIVSFQTTQRRARDDIRSTQAKTLSSTLRHYFDEHGEYPVCPGGPNVACSAAQDLTAALVPKYIQSIPNQPNNNPYLYIRGTSPDSFGILLQYETAPQCKTGTNMDQVTWWGGSGLTPNCTF